MPLRNVNENLVVTAVDVKDMRWPTSLGGHGSDAMVCYDQVEHMSVLILIPKMFAPSARNNSTPTPTTLVLM